jgi:hypothetical protein
MSTRERVMKNSSTPLDHAIPHECPDGGERFHKFPAHSQAVLRGFPLPVTEAGAPAGMCGRCRHSGQNKPIFIR